MQAGSADSAGRFVSESCPPDRVRTSPRVGIRGDIRYRWGVGGKADEDGWGLLDNWTYWRGSIGLALAF